MVWLIALVSLRSGLSVLRWTCCLLQASKDQKAVGRLLIILLFEPQVGGCTFPDQVYTYTSSCFDLQLRQS